jgi:transcriptional regulator with XRE-family HTH domain
VGRFKECRLTARMGAVAAARRLGIGRNTLWRYESGRTIHWDHGLVMRMADLYGVTVEALTGADPLAVVADQGGHAGTRA